MTHDAPPPTGGSRPEKIVVTKTDIDRPEVSAQLSRAQTFGYHAPTETKQPLLFRPWLALGLAGMLGAFVAWSLLEPVFDDGVRFRGQVQDANWRSGHPPQVLGRFLRVNGVNVFLLTNGTVLDRDGEQIEFEAVSTGETVEVLSGFHDTAADGTQYVIATLIKKLSSPVPLGRVDLEQLQARNNITSLLLFPVTAALIGLFIGACDGVMSRAFSRALLSGVVGLLVGFVAGFIALIPAGLIFKLGSTLAEEAAGDSMRLRGGALLLHMIGRSLAWAVAGLAAGIGQGIAIRSKRLFVNGALGGGIGALIGGIAFDPLNLLFENVYRSGGAEISRALGLVLIGAATGAMIGIVELVAREAWIRVLSGPITGKEFVLYRNPTWIGSSPKCEIYLFKDPLVAARHASISRAGEHYEIEDQGTPNGTTVSGSRIRRRRLRDADRITIGNTAFLFKLRDQSHAL